MDKATVVARFEEPTASPASSSRSMFHSSFEQRLEPAPGPKYKGKIVMLIDNSAMSQAEHTCLMIAAAHKTTFIGTPTMGTNGDVSGVLLPGNMSVYFSGHSVAWPNGRQLQRVGVQPDYYVARTIAGVRAGKDEILDAALKSLGYPPEPVPAKTAASVHSQ